MGGLINLKSQYFKRDFFYQYVATFTGTLIIVSAGMQYAWPSPSLPILLSEKSKMAITNSEGSWIAISPSIGMPIGNIAAAVIADRIGRKRSILIASPFFLIAWVGTAYARSVLLLTFSRFIGGIGDGLVYGVLPMYVGEIANKKIRGFLGSSIQLASTFGVCTMNIIGLYFSIRASALIAAFITLLHFVTFYFMPESPYYLILKGREQIASSELKKLSKGKHDDTEIVRLHATIASESKESLNFLDIFRNPSNRKALCIILGLKVVEQISGYHAISFYTLTIFKEANSAINPNTAMIIYSCVHLIVTTTSALLVDLTGRKILLIISVVGSGCALLVEGVYFYLKNETNMDLSAVGFLPVAALLFYTVAFNIGLVTVPMLILSELFATSVKAASICITGVFFAILLVVVSKFFQIVKDEFGMHIPFFIFSSCCVISLFFIIYFVPETKGKTLEQIQIEMRSSSAANTSDMVDQKLQDGL